MSEKPINGFCVKYALTQGVFALSAKPSRDGRFVLGRGGFALRIGTEFFADRAEADAAAKAMATRKIASLRRQIRVLEGLETAPKWSSGVSDG